MEFLRLERSYKTTRDGQRVLILAGDYAEDDPALCGLYQYLLDTDHAEIVRLPSGNTAAVKETPKTAPKSKD